MGVAGGRRPLLLVVCALLGVTSAKATPLPHVSDCYMCHTCHTGTPPGRRLLASQSSATSYATYSLAAKDVATTELRAAAETGETDSTRVAATRAEGASNGASEREDVAGRGGEEALPQSSSAGRGLQAALLKKKKKEEEMYVPPGFKFQIMPLKEEIESKSAKPNCTECYGCDTQIVPLQAVGTTAMGQNMRIEVGASPEWLFFADLPDTAATGRKAVLKVWCMPIDKVRNTFAAWRCSNTAEGAKAVQFLLAQQKVMEECGLLDVTIKVWPGRVNAVVPKHGLHVWWDALWMERAEGISLNQISYKRQRSFVAESLTAIMGERLNKTRVVRAAIHDLLSSQCDRHAQNVFLTETGQLKLIDNLQALQFSWVNCAMDSIFLPGTQKNMIVRWGGNIVGKLRNAKARRSTNPMVVLDYRCYVPGGAIGTNYDPKLKQCLKKISGMTPREIQVEYGFPYSSSAKVLQTRAADMLNKGFEWTLRYGQPASFKPKSYRQQQPCCNLTMTPKGIIECGHPWSDHIEVPYGDPQNGGEWRRPYPDPGTYEGGTFLDDPQFE